MNKPFPPCFVVRLTNKIIPQTQIMDVTKYTIIHYQHYHQQKEFGRSRNPSVHYLWCQRGFHWFYADCI